MGLPPRMPVLRKQKSSIVKLKQETNSKEAKAKRLIKLMKKFEEVYQLKNLELKDQSIIPSYQNLKTSYQKKGRKYKKKNLNNSNGLVGLKNLGNTCYINASLQLLSNLQPLSDYFIESFSLAEINRQNPQSTKGCLTVALANIIKGIWQMDIQKLTQTGIPVVIPEEFIDVVSYCNSQFGQSTQQDAQEFLMYLLDMVHEDLNRVCNPIPLGFPREYSDINDLMEQEILAAISWGDYLKSSKSIIVDLMQGQSKNSLTCKDCKYQSFKFEPLMYLSLPIPERDEVCLMDCLNEYLKEETLEEENQWFCAKCKVKVDAIKKIDLWKLPTILIIHLKRFQYTLKGFTKIQKKINIPVDQFNLTQALPKYQKEKPIYELLGVICHSGTINKGHYYTYARSKENFNWYLFNDKQVKEVSQDSIPNDSAYVLMYGKSTIPLIKRQTISVPENWPHVHVMK